MDKLSELRVFVAAADTGNLSAAARKLSLTPSAASKALARLEQHLGVRLLDRSTRQARLTEEGRLYYDRCINILRALDAAEHELTQRRTQARGTLRVNASVPFAHYVLAPLLPEFLREHPDVELELNVTDGVVDLFEQRADVAIRVGPLADSSLLARKLGDIRRVLVASPDYVERHGTPEAPAQLADHHCLNFNLGERLNTWRFRDIGDLRASGRVRVNCGDTIRHLALAGTGIARLGTFVVAADIASGALVTLLDEYLEEPPEPVHAVLRGEQPLPRRTRAFVDYLAERVQF